MNIFHFVLTFLVVLDPACLVGMLHAQVLAVAVIMVTKRIANEFIATIERQKIMAILSLRSSNDVIHSSLENSPRELPVTGDHRVGRSASPPTLIVEPYIVVQALRTTEYRTGFGFTIE